MVDSNIQSQELKLGKGSKIVIALFSFLFALMMLPMAFDPIKPELGFMNFAPSAFCFLIVGACIFPARIRGYFCDLIALIIIGISIWFFIVSYQDPQPRDNPIKFAAIFGGFSVAYLISRYRKGAFKKNT